MCGTGHPPQPVPHYFSFRGSQERFARYDLLQVAEMPLRSSRGPGTVFEAGAAAWFGERIFLERVVHQVVERATGRVCIVVADELVGRIAAREFRVGVDAGRPSISRYSG